MKEYTNSKGFTIKRNDTFSYKHANFTIERIYRNKLGVVKVQTTNGVILDADNLRRVDKDVDTKNN